ncbi:MAG: QueT transporter family protein [Clostridia bacterium]|nr:QueT transporter family protein [Clostridia bacterium]
MKDSKTLNLTQSAIIAALYVVLTIAISAVNLASGVIQFRISEALTILPFFTAAAIPGLAVGCFLSNLITGCAMLDVVFGTLATLIGALGTRALRKNRWLAPLPPILANAFIVPFVLRYAYGVPDAIWFMVITVGIGEIISCGVLGEMLLSALQPMKDRLFK